MGLYSTSLHHSHLFRKGKNEVWCKNWCKWCIAIFSFGFDSIAIVLCFILPLFRHKVKKAHTVCNLSFCHTQKMI